MKRKGLIDLKSPTENMRKVTEQILSQRDLYDILPFGKTKVQQLIASGELPLVKVGKDYITTFSLLEKWIQQNIGEEIYY